MDKSKAGKLGAASLRRKIESEGAPRGAWREHMRHLGSLGGRETWRRYTRVPVGTSSYAIVRKSDGRVMRVDGRGY